jgi:formylglycine-generating enzyme required for sulfatase activity
MVRAPAGSFSMGSLQDDRDRLYTELPQHEVRISRPFAIGKLDVTVGEFRTFVTETGYEMESKCIVWTGSAWTEREGFSWRNPGFVQEDSHPVVCVSWNDAQAYIDWLAHKTHQPYRMLSEAEWEYAARMMGLAPRRYLRSWFGVGESDLCRDGNGADQAAHDTIEGTERGPTKTWTFASCNDGYAYTSPVGHFPANALGLHDMFGNTEQWTADCAHESYLGAPADGRAWTTANCNRHVSRGGSWSDNPARFRATRRSWFEKVDRVSNYVGFRVARTIAP